MRQIQNFLRFLIFCLAMLVSRQIGAQIETPTLLNTDNTFIQERIESSDSEGWLFFKNSSDLKEGQLFNEQPSAAGLSADDNMVLIESEADEQGNTHNRYQQYYKGIKVEGGEIFEHVRDCYVYLLHGKIIKGLSFNAQPMYTKAQALNAATAHIGASQYAWENSDWEQELKDDMGDSNATYFPTGILVLTYTPGTSLEMTNYQLTWRFEILAITPSSHKTIYVNASTGAILKILQMEHDNGPAKTLYDGIQTIDTEWAGGLFHGHHHLIARDNEKNVETRNGTPDGSWGSLGEVFDTDDVWGVDPPTVATTGAHWVVTRSWEFFKNTYGRKGMDNNNKKVRVIGNSTLEDNAYWDLISGCDYIVIGSSSEGNRFGIPAGTNFASLDLGGHEFTHGIARREANFVYEGESGALDESFADIFGVMVERYARGGTFNWMLSEDFGFIGRNMQTPALSFDPQPNTYLTGPFWVNTVGCVPTGNNDLCGVHTNSGVQNRWFFLLSQGGTQNGVTVQGIGIDKAARIAYHNLCNFLGSNSNHPQSRLGAIASARSLYGNCSNEVVQTTNAWAAVGVGPVFAGNCVTLRGEPFVCDDIAFFPFCYIAEGFTGASFTWDFPLSWSGTTSGPGNKYLCITSFGNFNPPGGFPATVTITVTSSLGGSESMTVVVEDDCRPLCEGGGERSGQNWERIDNV